MKKNNLTFYFMLSFILSVPDKPCDLFLIHIYWNSCFGMHCCIFWVVIFLRPCLCCFSAVAKCIFTKASCPIKHTGLPNISCGCRPIHYTCSAKVISRLDKPCCTLLLSVYSQYVQADSFLFACFIYCSIAQGKKNHLGVWKRMNNTIRINMFPLCPLRVNY